MDAQIHSDYTGATPAYTLETSQAQVSYDHTGKITSVVGTVASDPPLVTGLASSPDGLFVKDALDMEWGHRTNSGAGDAGAASEHGNSKQKDCDKNSDHGDFKEEKKRKRKQMSAEEKEAAEEAQR